MGFRFRKSFTILPGVRVNLGKSGVTSVSVGGKGVRLTTGKRGTTVTTCIHGTGLSYSQRVDGPSRWDTGSDAAPVPNPYAARPLPQARIEDFPPYQALATYALATPHPLNRRRLGWWRRIFGQRPSAPSPADGAPAVPSSEWLAGRLQGFDLPVPEILVEPAQGGRAATVRMGYDRYMGTPLTWDRQFADQVRDLWLRVVGYRALGELFQLDPALETVALTGYRNDGTRKFAPALADYSVLVTRAEWEACFYPVMIAPALGDCLNSFGLRAQLTLALPVASHIAPYELDRGRTG